MPQLPAPTVAGIQRPLRGFRAVSACSALRWRRCKSGAAGQGAEDIDRQVRASWQPFDWLGSLILVQQDPFGRTSGFRWKKDQLHPRLWLPHRRVTRGSGLALRMSGQALPA